MGTLHTERPTGEYTLHTPRRENHGTRNALLIGGAVAVLAIAAALAMRGDSTMRNPEDVAGVVATPPSGTVTHSHPPTPAASPTPRHRPPAAAVAPAAPRATGSLTIPQGTPMTVELRSRLTTKESRVGDTFTAVTTGSVEADGRTAIPAGSAVNGRVIMSEQPGKASGRGKLQLQFTTVEFNGRSYDLGSRSSVFQSDSGTEKDVAIIGGGAAAGGIAGAILGKDPESAAKGAVIGGAAGTAVSLLTRGPQLELAPGTKIQFSLDQPVTVRPPSNQNS